MDRESELLILIDETIKRIKRQVVEIDNQSTEGDISLEVINDHKWQALDRFNDYAGNLKALMDEFEKLKGNQK